MSYVKRVFVSLFRQPIKTFVTFLLITVIGIVVSGAITVSMSINRTNENLLRSIPPIVSIDIDWDALWLTNPDAEAPEQLTTDQLREFASFEQVETYILNHIGFFQTHFLERVVADRWIQQGEPQQLYAIGTSTPNIAPIETGAMVLISGRQFTQEELKNNDEHTSPIIVSEEFAIKNDLHLGSFFSLYRYNTIQVDDEWVWAGLINYRDFPKADVNLEFEVIGFFDVPINLELLAERYGQGGYHFSFEYQSREQLLDAFFVPNWVFEDLENRHIQQQQEIFSSATIELPDWAYSIEPWLPYDMFFILYNVAFLDEFKQAVEPYLSEFHTFYDFSSTLDSLSGTMNNLNDISNFILVSSIIASILILGLIIMLFLNDRRKEVGIYLALGEKKKNVAIQIFLEITIVSLIGVTVALFIGERVADSMSSNMIKAELLRYEEESIEASFCLGAYCPGLAHLGFIGSRLSVDEIHETFDVSLNTATIIIFYSITLGVVGVSSLLPIIMILKSNPKKLLL